MRHEDADIRAGKQRGNVGSRAEQLHIVANPEVTCLLGECGADAEAVAYVALSVGSKVYYGVGCNADVVLASFQALVTALNRATPQDAPAKFASVS